MPASSTILLFRLRLHKHGKTWALMLKFRKYLWQRNSLLHKIKTVASNYFILVQMMLFIITGKQPLTVTGVDGKHWAERQGVLLLLKIRMDAWKYLALV